VSIAELVYFVGLSHLGRAWRHIERLNGAARYTEQAIAQSRDDLD
jgi:hypothetical protein